MGAMSGRTKRCETAEVDKRIICPSHNSSTQAHVRVGWLEMGTAADL